MKYQAAKKVEGGKLLKVKIDVGHTESELQPTDRIVDININGDFFLHPEDAIRDVEESLKGLGVREPAASFANRIHRTLNKTQASFIGVSADDIAETIKEALGM